MLDTAKAGKYAYRDTTPRGQPTMTLLRTLDEARHEAEQAADRSMICMIDQATDALLDGDDRITPDTLLALGFADPREAA